MTRGDSAARERCAAAEVALFAHARSVSIKTPGTKSTGQRRPGSTPTGCERLRTVPMDGSTHGVWEPQTPLDTPRLSRIILQLSMNPSDLADNVLGAERPRRVLHVDMDRQTLTLWLGRWRRLRRYPVSTAAKGPGFIVGSETTPTGLLRIAKVLGHGASPGMIFKGRRPVGQLGTEEMPGDLVQSRILWLEGLQLRNRNTKARYIYIHGTNRESLIGLPVSHGCVRLRNTDMIDLFTLVRPGDAVAITPPQGMRF